MKTLPRQFNACAFDPPLLSNIIIEFFFHNGTKNGGESNLKMSSYLKHFKLLNLNISDRFLRNLITAEEAEKSFH